MAYEANVILVMIAAPSDLNEEREIIKSVIYDWNNIHSKEKNIVLLPVSWDTHSVPQQGGHPQSFINKNVLSDCDLLIGMFWTRAGTQTEKYISGTDEEIEEHKAKGKPAMIYFSEKAVKPGDVDSEQNEKVKEIKEKYKGDGIIGIFSSDEELKDKLKNNLHQILQQDKYLQEIISEEISINVPLNEESEEDIIQNLSNEAKELLKFASNRPDGSIRCGSYIGGNTIGPFDGRYGGTARELAKWEAALEEIHDYDLIKQTDIEGNVFKLTEKGWDTVDLINEDDKE